MGELKGMTLDDVKAYWAMRGFDFAHREGPIGSAKQFEIIVGKGNKSRGAKCRIAGNKPTEQEIRTLHLALVDWYARPE